MNFNQKNLYDVRNRTGEPAVSVPFEKQPSSLGVRHPSVSLGKDYHVMENCTVWNIVSSLAFRTSPWGDYELTRGIWAVPANINSGLEGNFPGRALSLFSADPYFSRENKEPWKFSREQLSPLIWSLVLPYSFCRGYKKSHLRKTWIFLDFQLLSGTCHLTDFFIDLQGMAAIVTLFCFVWKMSPTPFPALVFMPTSSHLTILLIRKESSRLECCHWQCRM